MIFERGLWDDADKYSDSLKEKEVEWVGEFNNYILKEARKHNIPLIDIGDRKNLMKKVMKTISF